MTISKTLIVDYGMGNLASVKRAFEECAADAFISDNPADIKQAARIVLPGVGAFADGMAALSGGGWLSPLRDAAKSGNVPLLGICLGMQLLADSGFEGGETKGLGLIHGHVQRLIPSEGHGRIPHVGWNEVNHSSIHPIFSGITTGIDFYFAHSYHFLPANAADVLASTPYCGSFVSVVARDTLCGVQFHPEKSSRAGFQFLKNFLAL